MDAARCRDLIHPHHDNELVQSQAAACPCDREAMPGGMDFVRHWMHVGFVNGERMQTPSDTLLLWAPDLPG